MPLFTCDWLGGHEGSCLWGTLQQALHRVCDSLPCMSISRGREEVSHCSGEITPYEWDGDGQSRLSNGRNAYPSTEQHFYLFQCKFALVGFKHYDDTSEFNIPVYGFPCWINVSVFHLYLVLSFISHKFILECSTLIACHIGLLTISTSLLLYHPYLHQGQLDPEYWIG